MDDCIIRAKVGDELAIEEIVSRYKGLIRAVANRFFLVGGDKDDLLQEGMVGLYFAIMNFDEKKGSFPSFVKLCVMRQIIDAVKGDSAEKNKALENCLDLTFAEDLPDVHTPLENLLEKEFSERFNSAVAQNLTATERQAVQLFAEGYSYDDIAEKMQKSYKAVDGALQRARRKLQLFLVKDNEQ